MSCEPQFHFFEDCLPESDTRAYQTIKCVDCNDMVHAGNNETMDAWFDTAIGAICISCFTDRYKSVVNMTNHWSFDDLPFEEGAAE